MSNFNYAILKDKIIEKYKTIDEFLFQVGMSKQNFYFQINKSSKGFSVNQIKTFAKALNLNNDEIIKIFFDL